LNFRPKYIFYLKFLFFGKNLIFAQNFNFLSEVSIFAQNFTFYLKFRFSSKISIFDLNFEFCQISILTTNFHYRTKFKFGKFSPSDQKYFWPNFRLFYYFIYFIKDGLSVKSDKYSISDASLGRKRHSHFTFYSPFIKSN